MNDPPDTVSASGYQRRHIPREDARPVNNLASSSGQEPLTPGTLAELFYERLEDLGRFDRVTVDTMSDAYRELLAHEQHMTVTVERWHGSPVDVQVLDRSECDGYYARKILLRRQDNQQVVQFGIVRLHFEFLDANVRAEIESCSAPLGRILIQHGVLRGVHLRGLWRVQCGQELANHFGVQPGTVAFGRTAIIHCSGEPAIELLEIVTPE